mgnify:CR=1 FL=1
MKLTGVLTLSDRTTGLFILSLAGLAERFSSLALRETETI